MYNGILGVYKEQGFTSHDVVAVLRGILGQRKIGHTGTLDPAAEGVLPVCLGNATKLCDMLTDRNKEYVCGLVLGMATDTEDITGTIINEKKVEISKERITEIINSFVGEYSQIPPMYSALKVNGQKLCDLARMGREVERKPRNVRIFEIEILDISMPEIKLRIVCSKGTYIRSLCRDIGEKAGCFATMKSLIRTKVGAFGMKNVYKLSEIEEYAGKKEVEKLITPTDEMFPDYEKYYAEGEIAKRVQNGNKFRANLEPKIVRVYLEGAFVGIYEKKDDFFVPVKMFF